MLLELTVGDAYGGCFEFAREPFLSQNNTLEGYVQHPRFKNQKPNAYTDDAQQTIALAELLVSDQPWTRENIADKFYEVYHRDVRVGYSRGFTSVLKKAKDGADLLSLLKGDSTRNGAAMRAAPVGVLPSIDEVIEKTKVQAAVTHNSEGGINAAVAAALMPHFMLYGLGKKAELATFLMDYVPGPWAEPFRADHVPTDGIECLHAAAFRLMADDSLSSLLKECVGMAGDADTLATIALAAASCSAEFEQDLPQVLIDDLENGTYGRDYIIELDGQLMALAQV